MKRPTVKELVKLLDLKPHPEGGFFRETYRAAGRIRREALPGGFSGDRNFSTAILYLLPRGAKSRLHRIASDEVWHFHLGGPLSIYELSTHGAALEVALGPDLKAGQRLQHVVPAGTWFSAEPAAGSPYSLVGCTVAPGFDFSDFELGKKKELLKRFAAARELVERFG